MKKSHNIPLIKQNIFVIYFFLIAEQSMERDRFMNPLEALEFGLIDKVMEHPPLPQDNGQKTD